MARKGLLVMATPSVEEIAAYCTLEEKDLLKFIDESDFNKLASCLSEWKQLALEFKFTMSKEIDNIESNNKKEEDKKINFLKELKQQYSFNLTFKLLVSTLLELKRAEDAKCICLALAGKHPLFIVAIHHHKNSEIKSMWVFI